MWAWPPHHFLIRWEMSAQAQAKNRKGETLTNQLEFSLSWWGFSIFISQPWRKGQKNLSLFLINKARFRLPRLDSTRLSLGELIDQATQLNRSTSPVWAWVFKKNGSLFISIVVYVGTFRWAPPEHVVIKSQDIDNSNVTQSFHWTVQSKKRGPSKDVDRENSGDMIDYLYQELFAKLRTENGIQSWPINARLETQHTHGQEVLAPQHHTCAQELILGSSDW